MKLYEIAAQQNPQYLLTVLNTVGGTVDIAQKLLDLKQPEMAQSYLDIAEYFTKAIMDDAVLQPTEGVAAFLGLKPLSSVALAQKMGATTPEGKKSIKKELRKLIKDGIVVKVGRSYALAGKHTPEPVPA
jgi:hypothetical protein